MTETNILQLPSEVLELILRYCDGETLLQCELVSPEFRSLVERFNKTPSIWKNICLKEMHPFWIASIIQKMLVSQIVGWYYLEMKNNWDKIYHGWYDLKNFYKLRPKITQKSEYGRVLGLRKIICYEETVFLISEVESQDSCSLFTFQSYVKEQLVKETSMDSLALKMFVKYANVVVHTRSVAPRKAMEICIDGKSDSSYWLIYQTPFYDANFILNPHLYESEGHVGIFRATPKGESRALALVTYFYHSEFQAYIRVGLKDFQVFIKKGTNIVCSKKNLPDLARAISYCVYCNLVIFGTTNGTLFGYFVDYSFNIKNPLFKIQVCNPKSPIVAIDVNHDESGFYILCGSESCIWKVGFEKPVPI